MVQLVVDDEVEIGVRRLEIRTFPFTLIAGREIDDEGDWDDWLLG